MYIFYHSGFLSNMNLPWKTELPWKFSLYLIYIFIIQDFWAICACLENEIALKFFIVLNTLFTFKTFEQVTLALKNRMCPEFTVLKYFLSFRIFEQVALDLKTKFPLKIFKPGCLPPSPPRTPMLVFQALAVFDQPFEIKAQNPWGWKPQNYSGAGRDPTTNCC